MDYNITLIQPDTYNVKMDNVIKVEPPQESIVVKSTEEEQVIIPQDVLYNKVVVEKLELQTKEIEPSQSPQVVVADEGYDGLKQVNINAVTSEIDDNIKPENIKNGVEILGVNGNLEVLDFKGAYLVQVVDYDGTVLKSDRLNTGEIFTLPDSPAHDKLVFQNWSSPVTITDNTITVGDSDITIGATYKTASGLSEFDITLTKVTGLDVTCAMEGNKDWGDGTTDSETTHTYADYGNYTITCDGTIVASNMFGQSSSAFNYYCTDVRIGENVTSIGKSALQYCYSLTSITIPNSVTSISSWSFHYCCSLKSVTIPNSITYIEYQTFNGCVSITSIIIPNSVTGIYQSSLRGCYSMTSITIPYNMTSIPDYSFENWYSLKSVTIPNNVTKILGYAFYRCYSLTSVTIPNSVTSIGSYAFNECLSLTSIVIPGSLTSIGNYAFYNCRSVTKYDFSNATSVPTLSSTNAFNNINKICKIIVPDDLYDEWIVATNWTTYADYIYKASETGVNND